MADRVRAWHATDEGAAKHSAGQKRRFASKEGREHIARLSERRKTPEWRKYLSEREKARMQDPEQRARLAEIGRQVYRDPIVRERARERRRQALQKEENRQAMLRAARSFLYTGR